MKKTGSEKPAPKMEKAGVYSPAANASSGWAEFEHWVYCPDAPGKCKCDTKK